MNRLVRRCESVCSAKACSDEHLTPSSEWLVRTADSQINNCSEKSMVVLRKIPRHYIKRSGLTQN